MSENIEALLAAAGYDSVDAQGRTSICMVAANGHVDIVEYLINRGVEWILIQQKRIRIHILIGSVSMDMF